MFLIVREGGDDDLDFIPHVFGEERAQGPVGQPRDEDRIFGRASLAPEPVARNAPGGIQALLEVHAQGEEVNPLADIAGHGGRRQEHRIALADGDGTPGLLREMPGLDRDFALADGHAETLCVHGIQLNLRNRLSSCLEVRDWKLLSSAALDPTFQYLLPQAPLTLYRQCRRSAIGHGRLRKTKRVELSTLLAQTRCCFRAGRGALNGAGPSVR